MSVTNRAMVTGLKNIYVAQILSGDTSSTVPPVYDTPVYIGGAAQLGYDPAFSQTTYYADDQPAWVFSSHGEMSFTMSIDDILPQHKAMLYGQTYVNGYLADKTSDEPPYFAIMGEKTRGSVTERFIFAKVQFAKGAMTVDTKGSSVTPQPDAVSGRMIGLKYNTLFSGRVRSDDDAKNATQWANWFTTPQYAPSLDTGAVTVAAAAGGAGEIVFTFTKAGGGNANMNSASIIYPNVTIALTSGYVIQVPTAYTLAAVSGATQTLTVTGLTSGASTWFVSANVKDVNGVGVTAKMGTTTVT